MVNGRFKGVKRLLRLRLGTGGYSMRVLLIEDEPTTAKSIELMLGAEGFNVYTTDLGEEGLDLGKLYDYDIILLDLNLPDMHGYDVLKKLRTAKVSTPGAQKRYALLTALKRSLTIRGLKGKG